MIHRTAFALSVAAAALLAARGAPAEAQPPAKAATPTSLLAAATPDDWITPPPDQIVVMDLAAGGRVLILLAPDFAPVHVANIRAFVAARWYDGLWIERVQDNYVAQWGDPDGRKPLPAGVALHPPAEYERAAAGLAWHALPYRDAFAREVGLAGGWPAARDRGIAWPTHCYGTVGVGRDLNPDTGTGGELYAVIGQSPRALDRNIAIVGRVISGIDRLSSLPRGTGALGFYEKPSERVGIARVRLASDLAEADRPKVRVLRTDRPLFAALIEARANRRDDFFLRPPGAVDICNAMPPVRIGD